ncbi:Na+/H+ dicarboxylate symporter [Halalkaliarchaeum desulfuricum]|uniref:Na+/H+ dicarboxylate symporter n=1 Tax=Halalkaliarchaeum desulfuricum TaxID=2055893 RepID=A0A343TH14_9EURY|nr:Na+/H+ dicarboxylate symporter [Halalkaliarchaeum desulfuricum]
MPIEAAINAKTWLTPYSITPQTILKSACVAAPTNSKNPSIASSTESSVAASRTIDSANPKRTTTKIVARMSPSAIAAIGFRGTMPNITSPTVGGVASRASPPVNSTARPGSNRFATARPMTAATVVVTTYRPTVSPPTFPSFEGVSLPTGNQALSLSVRLTGVRDVIPEDEPA